MENNVIYLDCNREFAEVSEDTYNNMWTNKFDEIIIPKGSLIELQDTFINIQGIEGGSIEIRQDEIINMKTAFYISHSDFLVPKYDYKDTGEETTSIYNTSNDPLFEISQLKSIYIDSFVEYNPRGLFSENLYNKIIQKINVAIGQETAEETSLFDILSTNATLQIGGTEQPLFAVFINSEGYLQPVINNVKITIPKGIYGISQLSQLIQDQLTGNKANNSADVSQLFSDYANGDYDGTIKSQLTIKANAFPYAISQEGTTYTNFQQFLNEVTPQNINYMTETLKMYLYIPNDEFINLMTAWASGDTQPDNFLFTTYRGTARYMASIKRQWNYPYVQEPIFNLSAPKNNNNNNYIISFDPTINYEGIDKPQNYWNYNPLMNGYTIGTTDFQFVYNETNAGFAFQFLHTPRREMSHDMIGAQNPASGQTISHYKESGVLDTIIKTYGNILTAQDTQFLKNSILYPRQRSSGVIIYNWDFDLIYKNTDKKVFEGDEYMQYSQQFNKLEDAVKLWRKSFWYRLGFDYNQLNANFETVRSYDLPPTQLYGTTTNNTLDVSLLNTISSDYAPEQSTGNTDYINKIDDIELPYVLLQQVKTYGLNYPSKTWLGLTAYNYQTFKNVMYIYTQIHSIVTTSRNLTANRLPTLSNEGYFIITSDLIGAMGDTVKNNVPLPILGIVPKSNLSNQDYISSFQEIQHITSQDLVINNIKMRILNADLTDPYLNEKSSIILKITLNIQPQQTEVVNKEKQKVGRPKKNK
jgi:hypothetical protein